MFRLLPVICLCLLCLPTMVWSQESAARLPAPREADLTAAKKVVADVYKSDYEAAKTPIARQALAKKLLLDGLNTSDDAVSKFALLQIARKIAAQAGDVDLAYQAADATALSFRVPAAPLKAEVLTDAAETLRAPQDLYFFGRYADRLLPELRSVAAWEGAIELAKLAESAAKKNRDADLGKVWKDRQAELTQLKQAYAAALPALAGLEKSPGDAALNETVGKLNCFLLESWTTGLPMLALGMDPALQRAAEAELRMPATIADKLALADAWYEIAKAQQGLAQRVLFRHAYQLYGEVLPTMEGLTKAKVQVRANDCFTQGMPDRMVLSAIKPALLQDVQYSTGETLVSGSTVNGRVFPDSLNGHPPADGASRIVYELPGECKYLIGMCAFRDMKDDRPHNPVHFIIVGTTGELWRSPALQDTGKLTPFKVDLKGQKRIELIVHCKGFNGASHASWIEPMLQK